MVIALGPATPTHTWRRCVRGVCAACARRVRGMCVVCAWCVHGVCVACAWHVRGVCAAWHACVAASTQDGANVKLMFEALFAAVAAKQ